MNENIILTGQQDGEKTFLPKNPVVLKRLTRFFQQIHQSFPYYQNIFKEFKWTPEENPLKLLAEFPSLSRQNYRDILSMESLNFLATQPFIHDRSSGSYSEPVLRFSHWRDELAEETLSQKAFEMIGITSQDSVLSLEVGAPEIYTFYNRALAQLGVRDAYYINLTYQFEREIDALGRINPTTIISVPTVLSRALTKILEIYRHLEKPQLKRIIYMGEEMSVSLRKTLVENLNIEIFSFYGTTEVGGCAVECQQHQGLHLFHEEVVPTLREVRQISEEMYEGEIFFTTLHYQAQCLVKYEVNDLVQLSYTPCACGSSDPLMYFLQRKVESFPLYGIKFRYKTFSTLLEKEEGLLQIVLENRDYSATAVTFILEESLKMQQEQIEKLFSRVYEFDTLIKMKLVEAHFQYQALDQVHTRKMKKILDLRV